LETQSERGGGEAGWLNTDFELDHKKVSETGILNSQRCCASRVAEPPKEAWFSVAKGRRDRVVLAALGTCFIGYGRSQGIVDRW